MPKSKVIDMNEMFDDETLDAMDDAAGVDRLTEEKDFTLYYDLGEDARGWGSPSLEDYGLDSYAFSGGGLDFD
jgi:hypothetical protein